MKTTATPVLKASELHQVCVVVRDLEKSMQHYRDILGIEGWEVLEADPSLISDLMYHGNPVQGPFRFRAALAMVGPMQLELIQPVEGELIYSDFLQTHGEGLHHLGHLRVKDLDMGVQALEKAGFACLQRGRIYGGGFAYMDTVAALGFIVELLALPEGVPTPGSVVQDAVN